MSGYTQIPNWLFDDVMPKCDPNEWRIVCVIARQTFGWNKESDRISLSQFQNHSGIGSRPTVTKAIDGLIEKGLISREKEGNSYAYCVQNGLETKPFESDKRFRNYTSNGLETKPKMVQKLNTQKTKDINNNIARWVAFFEGMTGFIAPHETSMFFKADWAEPITAVIRQSDNDSEIEDRITYGVTAMRGKGYTIKSPRSILTFALNYNGNQVLAEKVKQTADGGLYV